MLAPERCWKSEHWPTNPGTDGALAIRRCSPASRVTIAGFIDHANPGSLDEIRIEFADSEERTVQRRELTSVFDIIQGHWRTREVDLAGGRLNPSESLAVARHSPDGFGWGDGGSEAAQLALAILLRASDRETAAAHYQAFKWDVIAKLPPEDFTLRLAKVRDWLASRVDL